MNRTLKNLFLVNLFLLCISCGGWQDFESAVSGAKKKTTDEYLIQKKDPLILPPDYEKLPLPSSNNSKNEEKNTVKSILDDGNTSSENRGKKSDLEKSIEEELRKNN